MELHCACYQPKTVQWSDAHVSKPWACSHWVAECSGEKTFTQPEEMKRYIPSLDNFKYRDKWWVIDVSGNSLRLISYIDFRLHKIFVKHIVSHAEYDKLTAYYRGNKEWELIVRWMQPAQKIVDTFSDAVKPSHWWGRPKWQWVSQGTSASGVSGRPRRSWKPTIWIALCPNQWIRKHAPEFKALNQHTEKTPLAFQYYERSWINTVSKQQILPTNLVLNRTSATS